MASRVTSDKAPSSSSPAAARERRESPSAPRVIESTGLMQAVSMALRQQGKTVGFVPTMGALHEGHLALVREARQRSDVVVVSIFVNPLQFGPKEDLSRYPRTLESDLIKCKSAGVDVVFLPDNHGMYPPGFETRVLPGSLAKRLEGKARPGHFEGVSTVCAKLFSLVQPHFAVFGEKDYQQLLVVRRMVRDLHLPLEIIALPVMRDVDGLALSSRNVRLSAAQRKKANCLYRAIMAAQDKMQEGERRPRVVAAAAKEVLAATSGFETDYAAVVDADTLEPLQEIGAVARVLVAGSFGTGSKRVRLIDNGPLFPVSAKML